jgi:hypothetical protein
MPSDAKSPHCLWQGELKRLIDEAILVSDWPISPPLKPLSQINGNLVGSIYGRSSIKIARSVNKHGHHRQFLFLIGQYLKNLLL